MPELTIKGGVDTRTNVSDDGAEVVADVTDIDFGADLDVTDNGDGTVTITASAGGGGGYDTVSTVTANYTASDAEVVLADASGGPITVTLPSASEGLLTTVKKIDSTSNAVAIATPNSETIDGQASLSLTDQYRSRELTSDGTNYYII